MGGIEIFRPHHGAQESRDVMRHQYFRHIGYRIEEIVPRAARIFGAEIGEDLLMRHDIDDHVARRFARPVERISPRDQPPPIGADNIGPFEPQRGHQRANIRRHRAHIVAGGRLVGQSHAAQIRRDYTILAGEQRHHLAPGMRSLRPAMQQHQRLPLAGDPDVLAYIVGDDRLPFNHHRHRDQFLTGVGRWRHPSASARRNRQSTRAAKPG